MSEIRQSKGMTLVEMMVAIAITFIVMAMSTSIFMSQYKSYNRGKNVKEAQQSGQEVIGLIKSDLMEAGWSVSPRMAFYFQDGGAVNGSDTIVLNDTSIISLANDPNARALVLGSNYPGCAAIINNTPSSSINVSLLDIDGDLTSDFLPGRQQYVISDGTVVGQKIARITTIAGNTVNLASNLTGTMVAPGIFYCVDEPSNALCSSGTATYELRRNDRHVFGRQPIAENVVDLQVAYKDNNDSACSANVNPNDCDAASGCGWLNNQCTGYWYGKAGCAGQGNGPGFCTLSPFDSGQVTLIRISVVTRSANLVDGSRMNPSYCRPAVENRTAAALGSQTDCGYVFRTYSAVIQPRSNRAQ